MRFLVFIAINLIFFSSQTWAKPIELKPGGLDSGKIYTECTFDSEKQKCFFDSGSATTSIADSPFSQRYKSIGKIEIRGASGSSVEADWIVIKRLQIADSILPLHQVARWPKDTPRNESLIGIDCFQGKTLQLDFRKLFLRSTRSPIPIHLAKRRFSFAPAGMALLEGQVDSQNAVGVWDTGAGLTSVDLAFVQKHPKQFKYLQDIPGGTDASGKPIFLKLYNLKNLTLGGKIFENLKVVAFDFTPAHNGIGEKTSFIWGYNLIQQSNWYVNMRTREWAMY